MTQAEAIAALERAEAASRDLDGRIGAAFRVPPQAQENSWITRWAGPFVPGDDGRIYLVDKEGRPGAHWPTPCFTGSLDARLPGEEIVRVELQRDGTWLAEARCAHGTFCGRGRTEVLARRAAAARVLLATGGRA